MTILTELERHIMRTMVTKLRKSYEPVGWPELSAWVAADSTELKMSLVQLRTLGYLEAVLPHQLQLTDVGFDFASQMMELEAEGAIPPEMGTLAAILANPPPGHEAVGQEPVLGQLAMAAGLLDAKPTKASAEALIAATRAPMDNFEERMDAEDDDKTLNVLFLDLQGFSRLDTHELPPYVSKVLAGIQEVLVQHKGLHANTWGDAVVAYFISANRAALAAMAIQRFFEQGEGVAAKLKPRIALHTGDVQAFENPIRKKELDVFGYGVVKAARLEPVIVPGYIFCTETFAGALRKDGAAKAWPLPERLQLAKKFEKDPIPVYVVTPRGVDVDPTPDAMNKLKAKRADDAAEAVSRMPEEELFDGNDAYLKVEAWFDREFRGIGNVIRNFDYTYVEKRLHLKAGEARRCLELLIPKPGYYKCTFEARSFSVRKA